MGAAVSIIIPVLNEQARIGEAIGRIRFLTDGGRRRSSSPTATRRGGPCGRSPRAPAGVPLRAGRGRQLNRAAGVASGDGLIFLHADTKLPSDALVSIGNAFCDPTLAGGAFDLAIDSPRRFFRLIERVASIRTRLTRIPYGDQAIFLRRDWFRSLGGFREIPIMEDVDLMRRLKRSGGRIVILPEPVLTSARRWEQEGILYATLRNWTLVTLFLLGVDARLLARKYRPHP